MKITKLFTLINFGYLDIIFMHRNCKHSWNDDAFSNFIDDLAGVEHAIGYKIVVPSWGIFL